MKIFVIANIDYSTSLLLLERYYSTALGSYYFDYFSQCKNTDSIIQQISNYKLSLHNGNIFYYSTLSIIIIELLILENGYKNNKMHYLDQTDCYYVTWC